MKKLLIQILIIMLIYPTSIFASGIPVFDAANLAQAITQATHMITSNINEATMIAKQIEQIANQLKNLKNMNFSIGDELSNKLNQLFSTMGSIHGIMQDLGTLDSSFEDLYPDFNNQDTQDAQTMSTTINNSLNESRNMMKLAAKTGAQVLENLPSSQSEIDTLVAKSQSAVGNLQVQQLSNQLLATISSNIINLNALMANYTQAHMAYMNKENLKEAAAKNVRNDLLNGYAPSTVGAVKLGPF